jgi:hypothetical protein
VTATPWRLAGPLVLAAAYGFAVGAVRSWRFATLNLVKFPLLILISVTVCAGAYFLVARVLAPSIASADVRRLALASYADLTRLLASLAPVALFLALTIRQPVSTAELGEYPFFLALNLVAIAGCGVLAVTRQTATLEGRHSLSRQRAVALVAAWLSLSLFVGGQAAWYLRPFFGVRAIPDDGSFCHGSRPDFRGARSFYEAVANLVPHGR